jgi:hypothetical protein
LSATASDSSGPISRVEFYQGSTLIATSASAGNPYTATWSGVAAASYMVTAKAYSGNASTVSAAVQVTVTGTGPATSATFVGTDTTTQGTWPGVYGRDGYNVINDTVNYPVYATVTPSGQASYTWAAATSDVRALQRATTGRIAATWDGPVFSIDVNLTDGAAHQLALYVVDWDSRGRTQTVAVRDAVTNALLDSRAVSSFTGGEYLVWTVSGHVTIGVTVTAGVNAVVSGLFFDP